MISVVQNTEQPYSKQPSLTQQTSKLPETEKDDLG